MVRIFGTRISDRHDHRLFLAKRFCGIALVFNMRMPSVSLPPILGLPATYRRPKNRLLATLPAADFQRIRPHLQTVPLAAKQVLLRRDEPIRHVFFPNGGMCSVTALMENGAEVEVATVGDEGMVGISAFFGTEPMPGQSMVQVPALNGTTAERLTVEALQREVDRHGALHDTISRYSHGTMTLMMQSIACLAVHHVNQRCCRWLLLTHDRIKADEFQLSHEFLGMMVAATRPTVTLVAGVLQKAGLIRYRRGWITILNRPGLEAASCECYVTVKTAFQRLGL